MASSSPNTGPYGIRLVAGGIVSKLKSIKHNRSTRDGRSRRRLQKKIENEDARPLTASHCLSACEEEKCPQQEHRPQTAPDELQISDSLEISVNTALLSQIFSVLQAHEDVPRADQHLLDSSREHSTTRRRIEYISYRTQEMKDWLLERKERILQRSTDPEAEAVKVNEVLADYTNRIEMLGKALLDIDAQESVLHESLNRSIEESVQLSLTVLDQLRALLHSAKSEPPLLINVEEFRYKSPVDLKSLKEWEDDYKGFVEDVLEQPYSASRKYPTRPTDDWHLHCATLEFKRKAYDEAVAELRKIQSHQMPDSGITAELQKQNELVATKQEELAAAVEAVRFAGIPCKSNGSFIVNRADSDFAEINYDVNAERRRAEEKAEGMTDEEVEEYLNRSRDVTEQWLSHVGLAQDPDKVGPISPRTPGSAGLSERLKDVGTGDSISVAGESQREDVGLSP